MVRVAPKPSLLNASCCMDEVVNGAGGERELVRGLTDATCAPARVKDAGYAVVHLGGKSELQAQKLVCTLTIVT